MKKALILLSLVSCRPENSLQEQISKAKECREFILKAEASNLSKIHGDAGSFIYWCKERGYSSSTTTKEQK